MLAMQRPAIEALEQESPFRQRFTLGPLERGFGHTIANSLRRTLLSAIPGAAITQVRFDDALHEFTTLPGVKEDVTDIILNLKDVVVRTEATESVVLRLDVRGPGQVTAGDFQANSDIEIVNPELVVATLAEGARLALDVAVEPGRGYLSAEASQGDSTIGVIPVDAIFSPVRRVAFNVEQATVDQYSDYERIVIDVETDGSLTPREAMSSAGATLSSLFSLVANITDQPLGLEIEDVVVERAGHSDLDVSIDDLNLSERPRNCLHRAGISTLSQLLRKTPDELLSITNFGQKSLDEVRERLDARGLALPGWEGTI
jgi:DNA-directed RNA polymerase subunit alpha